MIVLFIFLIIITIGAFIAGVTTGESEGFYAGIVFTLLVIITTGVGVDLFYEPKDVPPTPIDVYRGKTTLEITYRDSVAVDSVVVWKEE